MLVTENFVKGILYAYTVEQLKDMLRRLRLLTTGSKDELITRLSAVEPDELAAVAAALWQNPKVEREKKNTTNRTLGHHSNLENCVISPQNFSERERHDSMKQREHELLRWERDLQEREIRLLRQERDLQEREIRLLRQERDMIDRPEHHRQTYGLMKDIHAIPNKIPAVDGISKPNLQNQACIQSFKSKKREKKGSDSDSDSDENWGKNKKAPGSTAKKGGGKGKGGGYTRATTLSPELAAIMGAEQMARRKVIKKVWSIIKKRNLYDPTNKHFAICDEELMKVIGVKRFRTFGMMKYFKNHFVD